MEKFRLLLDAYLDRSATAEQQTELFRLIGTGAYDEYLKDRVSTDLRQELHNRVTAAEKSRTDQLYDRMVQSIAFPEEKRKASNAWRWLAAAAVLAGLMVGYYLIATTEEPGNTLATGPVIREAAPAAPEIARYTNKQLVILPDSSTVLLNANSELTYLTAAYGQESREVLLSGEAYFDIRKDTDRPFRVRTGEIVTTVLGTAFNIKSSPVKDEVRVTVTRGKVQVGDQQRTYGQLTPNEELVVNTSSREFTKSKTNAAKVTDWTNRFLIFDNVLMSKAIELLSKRFDTRLVLKNDNLGQCHISASFFNEEDLDQVLQVICTVNQATYERQSDGSIWLIGGNSCE